MWCRRRCLQQRLVLGTARLGDAHHRLRAAADGGGAHGILPREHGQPCARAELRGLLHVGVAHRARHHEEAWVGGAELVFRVELSDAPAREGVVDALALHLGLVREERPPLGGPRGSKRGAVRHCEAIRQRGAPRLVPLDQRSEGVCLHLRHRHLVRGDGEGDGGGWGVGAGG